MLKLSKHTKTYEQWKVFYYDACSVKTRIHIHETIKFKWTFYLSLRKHAS